MNPKGGRGNVAPYTTITVRVPEGVEPQVDAIVATYKELKLLGKEAELQQFIEKVESAIASNSYKNSTNLPTLEEARKIADTLLKQKQSKQITIEKLLQLLYNQE